MNRKQKPARNACVCGTHRHGLQCRHPGTRHFTSATPATPAASLGPKRPVEAASDRPAPLVCSAARAAPNPPHDRTDLHRLRRDRRLRSRSAQGAPQETDRSMDRSSQRQRRTRVGVKLRAGFRARLSSREIPHRPRNAYQGSLRCLWHQGRRRRRRRALLPTCQARSRQRRPHQYLQVRQASQTKWLRSHSRPTSKLAAKGACPRIQRRRKVESMLDSVTSKGREAATE